MRRLVKLKPCPFCGGQARRYEGIFDAHGICCTKCTAKIYGYASKATASRAWNRRSAQEVVVCGEKFILCQASKCAEQLMIVEFIPVSIGTVFLAVFISNLSDL